MAKNPLIRPTPSIPKISKSNKSSGILDDFAVRKSVQSRESYFNSIKLSEHTDGSILFMKDNLISEDNSNLFWDDTNNRLGVGITSPSANLQINGSGTQNLLLTSTDGGGINADFNVNDSEINFGSPNGVPLNFLTSNLDRMTITSGGNVGIGTTSPSIKLSVSGGPMGVGNTNDGIQLSYGTGYGEVLGLDTSNNNYNEIRFSTSASVNMVLDTSGNLGIGTASPNANAILDVTSTTKAFMPPRMTTTQRNNIASPTAGMVIYNTTTNVLDFYNGSAWGAV